MNIHAPPPLDPVEVAKALGGQVCGRSQVLAPGPGHSGRDRSLSVLLSNDSAQGFVAYSFAGDDALACRDYVRSKLGLPPWRPKSEFVAEYVYRQPDRTPYLKVARTATKAFPQFHWDGAEWVKGAPKGPRIPYRLPEVLSADDDRVFIVEGEKDVDTLAAHGLIATCNPMGAEKWSPDLNEWFRNKRIFILPDNDDAGRRHAELVARNLHGVARSVRVVPLPGLPPKGDVSDWIAAGGDAATLVGLCESGPPWQPTDASSDSPRKDHPESFGISFAALKRKEFPPVSFIVPDIMPAGCSILAGRPKVGKGWLSLDLGISVARGGLILGDKKCPEGDVLYLALEDPERRLQDRGFKMLPLQEWPERLTIATEWPRADQGGIAKIRRWCASVPNPRLVIVDVLEAFRGAASDRRTAYQNDYAAVAELRALANETGVAILIVHHVRKGDAEDPVDLISGTLGLAGAADTLFVLRRGAEAGVTLYGRGRDVEEIDLALQWMPQTCRWTVRGTAAEVKRSDERSQIIEALRAAGEPLTPTEIAAQTDMRSANVRQMLVDSV